MDSKYLAQVFAIVVSAVFSSSVLAIPSAMFTSIEAAVQAAADGYNPVSTEEDREYMG